MKNRFRQAPPVNLGKVFGVKFVKKDLEIKPSECLNREGLMLLKEARAEIKANQKIKALKFRIVLALKYFLAIIQLLWKKCYRRY